MNKPLLSILSITYNHEEFIAQAIESWLMQETDFDIEIVIGEDCSTDNTRQVIEKYRTKHSGLIKVITSEQNVGMQANFVRTLEACQGKYIALCEGDDYWTDPLKLQKQVDFLEKNEEYSICFHDTTVIDENDVTIKKTRLNNDVEDLSTNELIKGVFIPTLTVVYRNIIESKDYSDISKVNNADTFVFSLLGKYGKGKRLFNIKNAIYRVHKGGVWSLKDWESKMKSTINTLNIIADNAPKLNKNEILINRNNILRKLLLYLLSKRRFRDYIKINKDELLKKNKKKFNFYFFHIKDILIVIIRKLK